MIEWMVMELVEQGQAGYKMHQGEATSLESSSFSTYWDIPTTHTDKNASLKDTLGQNGDEEQTAAAFCVLLLLVAGVVWLSHVVKHSRFTFITQGSLALMVGLVSGSILYMYFVVYKESSIPSALVAFQYEVYMDLFLPPIIFYAGFSIKKKAFFSNFGALVTLGVFGTILSAVVMAMMSYFVLAWLGLDDAAHVSNSLALGVVLSSSDSVAALQAISADSHPQLHALVFGEAVVNDATAIVLLRAIQKIHSQSQLNASTMVAVLANFFRLSFLSLLLGVALGLLSGFILRVSFFNRHSTDREISLLAALGFTSYLAAEAFQLSGVFAVFFCGLTQSHYAWHTLSPSAKVVSIYAFRVMSFLAELLLFMCCGLDLWGSSLWTLGWTTRKSLLMIMGALTTFLSVAVVLTRFIVTMPLVEVINSWRPSSTHISQTNSRALSLAGCARGAVTLALAVNHFLGDHNDDATKISKILSSSCILTVVFSTIVLGGLIPLLFDLMFQADSDLEQEYSRISSFRHSVETLPAHDNQAVKFGIRNIKQRWSHIDKNVLQPIFGGRSLVAYRSPPPSPGRWRGARSAMHVLKRATSDRPKPPSAPNMETPFLDTTHIDEENGMDELPPGSPKSPEEDEITKRNALERIFSLPGDASEPEELVDGEIEIDGVLERAETFRDQGDVFDE